MSDPHAAEPPYVLRHSVAPFLAFAIPMALVAVIGLYAAYATGTASFLGYFLVPFAFYIPWVMLIRRYKISFTSTTVFRQASGMTPLSIDVDAIRTVKLESGGTEDRFWIRRPFRRISIYANASGKDDSFIDVSLKHFVLEDIQKLMRAIQARRPDLQLPHQWI